MESWLPTFVSKIYISNGRAESSPSYFLLQIEIVLQIEKVQVDQTISSL